MERHEMKEPTATQAEKIYELRQAVITTDSHRHNLGSYIPTQLQDEADRAFWDATIALWRYLDETGSRK